MNATKIRFEITSDCQCFTCTTCECGVIGNTDDGRCLDCGNELQSDTYCTGMCWEDANYSGELALDDWLNVEPVYGNCKNTIEGKVCTLQGYEWKGSK